MENNKERIKLFKRFMKEIGLYNSWVENRVKGNIYTEKTYGIKRSVWDVLNHYHNLSAIIFFSFTWARTDNTVLWQTIHYRGKNIDIDNYTAEDIEYIKKEIEPCLQILENLNAF